MRLTGVSGCGSRVMSPHMIEANGRRRVAQGSPELAAKLATGHHRSQGRAALAKSADEASDQLRVTASPPQRTTAGGAGRVMNEKHDGFHVLLSRGGSCC